MRLVFESCRHSCVADDFDQVIAKAKALTTAVDQAEQCVIAGGCSIVFLIIRSVKRYSNEVAPWE